MSRALPPRPRGMTLIELMVAMLVSAVVLVALFGVVQSQQRAFFQGHLQRAAQGSTRGALTYIEQRVMLAGYGMDAPLAFDFTRYGIDATQPFPCPALANGCPRDAVNGNDELVFYARNPRYWLPELRTAEPRGNAWRVTAVAGDTVTLNARPGDLFAPGRVLQLLCEGDARYAYATVRALVRVPEDGGVERAVTLSLRPSSEPDPFRRQDVAAADACFTSGTARAFLIDRYRFHVRPVQVGSDTVPYLVLDTGLDANADGVDEAEEIVIAEGIESFQVGYVMTNPALAPRGTVPGTAIAFTPLAGAPKDAPKSATGITTSRFPDASFQPGDFPYAAASWYRYALGPTPTIADERLTDHQANIRAVRIALVARGPDPDPAEARTTLTLPLLNQDALPAWIPPTVPYKRSRLETTVPIRNMVARALNE